MILGMGRAQNGIGVIISQIGKGASPHTGSAFFTTPQRSKIKSEITQAAGGGGQTFRKTRPELQSVILSNYWRSKGWVGSPHENDMATPAKRRESKNLAQLIQR